MNSFTKAPESKAIIRFPDCDPFNHLNNARYIYYFMNAREDHLWENYQVDIYKHSAKTGKGWMVSKSQIQYMRPAVLKEQVVIQSTVVRYNKHSLLVEMNMWDEAKTRRKALLWPTFTYVDIKTGRRAEHNTEFMDLFEQIVSDETFPESFDERILQLNKR